MRENYFIFFDVVFGGRSWEGSWKWFLRWQPEKSNNICRVRLYSYLSLFQYVYFFIMKQHTVKISGRRGGGTTACLIFVMLLKCIYISITYHMKEICVKRWVLSMTSHSVCNFFFPWSYVFWFLATLTSLTLFTSLNSKNVTYRNLSSLEDLERIWRVLAEWRSTGTNC